MSKRRCKDRLHQGPTEPPAPLPGYAAVPRDFSAALRAGDEPGVAGHPLLEGEAGNTLVITGMGGEKHVFFGSDIPLSRVEGSLRELIEASKK